MPDISAFVGAIFGASMHMKVSLRGSHLHRDFQLVSINDIHSPTYRR